jgi:DGQHR domain-containing protein
MSTKDIDLFEFDSFEQAQQQAAAAAASSFSQMMPCVTFEQAGRVYFSTAFPLANVNALVRFDSAVKGSNNPEDYTNRPVLPDHVRAISEYLTERTTDQEKYILPGITLNVREKIKVYTSKTASPVRAAIIVLPSHATFYVTDGQHRLKAVAEALGKNQKLRTDALPVTIVVEPDIEQIHQDFADCAQSRSIPPALLTLYNRNDELSKLTVEVANNVDFFMNRLEKLGNTVSKRSTNLFTLNHVRMSVGAAMTGDSSSNGPSLQQSTALKLTTDQERTEWKDDLSWFYATLSEHIPEWKTVREANLGGAPITDIVPFRAKYIHFTGTGLAVIGAVGNRILKSYKDPAEREKKVIALATAIDWTRIDASGNASPFWAGTILTTDGKMVTSRSAVQSAVDKIIATLQLAKPNQGATA